MKGMVIINPSSGMQIYQNSALHIVRQLLSDGTADGIFVVFTRGKDDAFNAARRLKEGEYDFVMAVGGDGTVNEIVNGLMLGGSRIPLVILPAGTTNDFATSLGLSRDVNKICNMIKNYRIEDIDVGKIGGKYFLNVVAGGMLSEIAHKVSSDAKTALGKMAYYFEGAREITNLRLDTIPLTIEFNNVTLEQDVFLLVIANSKSVGGFNKIAPNAKLNDGLLDVCILKRIDPLDILSVLTQIQRGVHIKNHQSVLYFQTSKIAIYSKKGVNAFLLDYDGEKGDPLPVTVEAVPRALRLIVPEKSNKVDKILLPS